MSTEQKDGNKGAFRAFIQNIWSEKNRDLPGQDTAAAPPADSPAEEAPQPEPQPAETMSIEEQLKDENILKAAGDALYELHCRLRGEPLEKDENAIFHLGTFMDGGEPPDAQQRGWLKGFERDASALQQKSKMEESEPWPAEARVKVSADKMSAWVFLLPPVLDGAQQTADEVLQALNDAGVIFGIDEGTVERLCLESRYLKLARVAEGRGPVDGVNGDISDHYEREITINLTVKDDNTIDYHDLGWLQTVHKDEVVCDIIPPTPATPGVNVLGQEVRGKDGRKAQVPGGPGTRVDPEGMLLLADIDGVVTFQSGRFRVDPLLIINGDVDISVGNLDVVGDLLVKGDVLEGYTVEASGNIIIEGMVEGAQLMAGGDIQVGRGMNGNSRGNMQAKGEIRCKFLENTTTNSVGNTVCDNIINSNISSDSSVFVTTGRGAIIGGQIAALERIEAITVGNQSSRSLTVNLGSTANFLRDKHDTEGKLENLTYDLEELEKNLTFIESGANSQLPEMVKMADDTKLKISVQRMQLANLERQLKVMQGKQNDNTKCRLRAETIYPPVQVSIGSASRVLRQMYFNATVYLKQDGTVEVSTI